LLVDDFDKLDGLQGDSEDGEDELEAFMKQNENQLRIEKKKKLGARVAELNLEIDKYTKLIALVAPTTLNKKATAVVTEDVPETLEAPSKQQTQPKSSIQSTLQRLNEMSKLKE
jgi:hypothetical protein